jgi:hypothetical protein
MKLFSNSKIINLRQIREIMNLFRNLYKDIEAEKDLLAKNPTSILAERREANSNVATEANNVSIMFIIKAYTG